MLKPINYKKTIRPYKLFDLIHCHYPYKIILKKYKREKNAEQGKFLFGYDSLRRRRNGTG